MGVKLMKKKFPLLLTVVLSAILFFCTVASLTLFAQTEDNDVAYICDVNGDLDIDLKDLIRIKKYISNLSDTNISLLCADINADSKINAEDIVLIRQELLESSDIESESGYTWSESYTK